METLKFIINKNKKEKKTYFLKKINSKKTTKFNNSLYLGIYKTFNIRLYLFIYPKIISCVKLGSNFAKQSLLLSLFYLKKVLNKNL